MKKSSNSAAMTVAAACMAVCLSVLPPVFAGDLAGEDIFQDSPGEAFSSDAGAGAASSEDPFSADEAAEDTSVLQELTEENEFQSAVQDPEIITEEAGEEALPSIKLQGNCTDTIWWEVTAEGELILTGSGDLCDYSAETPAPWHESGDGILAVRVGEGITRIGAYAFDSLAAAESISLPESLASIGAFALQGMTGLTGLRLDLTRTQMDEHALTGCKASLEIILSSASSDL